MNDKENPGLAIAYDDGSGDKANMGKATAESDANVTVIDGLLTLDKVPDFGFGTAAVGAKVDLQNNNSTIDTDDGNQSGILQVTDSRNDSANGTAGFNVQAQLGSFYTTADDGTKDPSKGDGFLLHMKSVPLTTTTDSKDAIQGATSVDSTLTSGASTEAKDIMNLAAGSYNKGAIIAQFAATTGSPNSNVSLKVPEGATGDKTPSSTSYTSVITWTLTPNPTTKAASN